MNEDGTPIDGGQAPAAPAPEGGAPAGGDPTPPADPGQQPAAPVDPQAPADPTIQPGQSPTDLDFEAMLDEIDNELAEEDGQQPNPDDPNAQQPPADPNNPDGQQPPKPEGEEEDPNKQQPQPPADPTALPEDAAVELDDYDRYFNVQANEELGIAPIGEIRNPEPGETAQDYYKNVTLPAVVQTVKNMTGFATHNQQVTERAQQQEAAQRDQATVGEIDSLVKAGKMPAYTLSDGAVDPNSEGGKVIGEVLKMAAEYNQKPENANRKITSFDHAFHSLYVPAQQAAEKNAKTQQQQQKRQAANSVLNPSPNGNGAGGSQNRQPQHIRKGQSVTDIDFEEALS